MVFLGSVQGCDQEAPGCHRWSTFDFGQLEKLTFFSYQVIKYSKHQEIQWLGTFGFLKIFLDHSVTVLGQQDCTLYLVHNCQQSTFSFVIIII